MWAIFNKAVFCDECAGGVCTGSKTVVRFVMAYIFCGHPLASCLRPVCYCSSRGLKENMYSGYCEMPQILWWWCHAVVERKSLSQILRSMDYFGHRMGGTTHLYIYWVEEAKLPHAHLQKIIVITWGGDKQHSWGALPSLNPLSHQCLCQQWQISCLILL